MNVLLSINGREAIPVRAIPFLTYWEVLSPDEVAEALVGDSKFLASFDGLVAYQVKDGATKPIRAGFWENFVARELEALSDRIKARQITHEDGQSQWRHESLAVLPAGSFVWRDEFEPRFRDTFFHDYQSAVSASSNGEFELVAGYQAVEIDFDPLISSDYLAGLVMEGFKAPGSGHDAAHVTNSRATKAEAPDAVAAPRPLQRRNILTPAIERAQKRCQDPFNTAAVWAELSEDARRQIPPLRGATEQGIQWLGADDAVQYLSLKMLKDRLKRTRESLVKSR